MRRTRTDYREGERVLVHCYDPHRDKDEREVCVILSVLPGGRYRVRPDDDGSFVVSRERIVRRA